MTFDTPLFFKNNLPCGSGSCCFKKRITPLRSHRVHFIDPNLTVIPSYSRSIEPAAWWWVSKSHCSESFGHRYNRCTVTKYWVVTCIPGHSLAYHQEYEEQLVNKQQFPAMIYAIICTPTHSPQIILAIGWIWLPQYGSPTEFRLWLVYSFMLDSSLA